MPLNKKLSEQELSRLESDLKKAKKDEFKLHGVWKQAQLEAMSNQDKVKRLKAQAKTDDGAQRELEKAESDQKRLNEKVVLAFDDWKTSEKIMQQLEARIANGRSVGLREEGLRSLEERLLGLRRW